MSIMMRSLQKLAPLHSTAFGSTALCVVAPIVNTNSNQHMARPSLTLARYTHNRSVPRSSTGVNRNQTGSVLGSGRIGGNGLFDSTDDDSTPTTRRGRWMKAGSNVYTYVFGGVLVVLMVGAAGAIGTYYIANPEKEVRTRTTKLLQGNPVAQRLIGPHMMDVTLRTKGSRGMQAHHRYPYFGEHPIEMEYVLQGKNGQAFVHVIYLKSGDQWKPIYLHLDTNHGRTTLLDVRARK